MMMYRISAVWEKMQKKSYFMENVKVDDCWESSLSSFADCYGLRSFGYISQIHT